MIPTQARFAALLRLHADTPGLIDLEDLVQHWPRPFALRLLAALPPSVFIASCLALPTPLAAARVAQLLRAGGLDAATAETVFDRLHALHAEAPARAFSLRRMMEWQARDTAFFAPDATWPDDETARAAEVALSAEADWETLPLPCIYRLPAPQTVPDAWTASPPITPLPLPTTWLETIDPVRAGIEWLHLARLDPATGQEIAANLPPGTTQTWLACLQALVAPDAQAPIPLDLASLEHLWANEHSGTERLLSQMEVDALLRGVSEEVPDDGYFHHASPEARASIGQALTGWAEWLDNVDLRY